MQYVRLVRGESSFCNSSLRHKNMDLEGLWIRLNAIHKIRQ